MAEITPFFVFEEIDRAWAWYIHDEMIAIRNYWIENIYDGIRDRFDAILWNAWYTIDTVAIPDAFDEQWSCSLAAWIEYEVEKSRAMV